MKRTLSFLSFTLCALCALLLLSLAAACGPKEPEKLRILIDQPYASLEADWEFKKLIYTAVHMGILESADQVEIEVLPNDPMDVETRGGALTRLRTEIVAGDGPDIFLIGTGTSIYNNELLFPYPKGVMAQGRFLKLDEYIENAQLMDWDALNPVVMAAGRNEEGQYLLPLSYTFPATIYNLAEAEPDIPRDSIGKLSKASTWADMRESEDPILRHAGILYNTQSQNRVASVFGPTDDGKEHLTFTQEEMEDIFKIGINQDIERGANQITALGQEPLGQADASVPQNCKLDMGRGFDTEEFSTGSGNISDWEMAIIPLCSRNGGVTATVSSYCAISSQTSDPETAFRLVELLLSKEIQRDSPFTCLMGMDAFPVYEGLMGEDEPVWHFWNPGNTWHLPEENWQALRKAQALITEAKFLSSTEEYLTLGFARCLHEKDKLEEEVERVYREMEMGLAES